MGEFSVVGKSVPRIDAFEKVTGKAKYIEDLKLPGMLCAKVLRSPYPHARIVKINIAKAEKLSKVRAVITGKDAPEERLRYFIRDRYILARDVVRFVGEPVAAVAADTAEIAEEALDLIEVEYEQLPAVFDAEEAMKTDPPVVIHPGLFNYSRGPLLYPLYRFEPDLPNVYVHRPIRKGDVEKGFQESDLILENRFSLPMAQHSCLERHNAIAQPEPDGGLTVWVPTHMLYGQKANLCRLLSLTPSKLRVISLYVGGCFGGKAKVSVPGIAALLALKTGKPVRLVFNRDEVFIDGNSREAMIIYIKDGVKADGTLLVREIRLILNAGAYSGTTIQVAKNAAFGAVGSYRVPNFKLDSYAVATNGPPTGAFRGFGSTEVIWAIESQMDMIAEELDIEPLEIRKKNLLTEGEEDICGMITHSIGARECLDKVAEWIEWDKKTSLGEGPWKIGKGIALANKYSMPATLSVVNIKVHQDATIEVRSSAHEVGQGGSTALAQIAAEEFGTSIDKIKMVSPDTSITPFDAGTVSSRTTFHVGNALRIACQDAKRQIFEMVSEKARVPPENLYIKDGMVYVKGNDKEIRISELFAPGGYLFRGGELLGTGTYSGPIEYEDPETGQGKRTVAFYAHGANAVEVMVNEETGEVKVLRIGACFDMGQPINPKLCEGQMEGGAGMGLGTALYEEMVLENGVVANSNFLDYKIPSSMDLPTCENVKSMIVTAPHREGPFGAKGFSEGAMVALSPAIANAISRATGVRIRDLPITKEKVLKQLKRITGQRNK
jgi:CO/xanthine dehydrogenase Mo-binding subunit